MITEGNTDRAKIIRCIQQTESTKRMYTLLKRYLKPEDHSGLTHIYVPEWDKLALPMMLYLANKVPVNGPWWKAVLTYTLILHNTQ
eukprot:2502279-Ditylum_brightwellii.AAC.1